MRLRSSLACARLNVAVADTIMIGDSENDLLSARAAGCRAILVEGGYNEGQPVAALPAGCYSRNACRCGPVDHAARCARHGS